MKHKKPMFRWRSPESYRNNPNCFKTIYLRQDNNPISLEHVDQLLANNAETWEWRQVIDENNPKAYDCES